MQNKYYSTLRHSPSPYKTQQALENDISNKQFFRESLMEHVGHLPILASYMHQYLETDVDLGKVLIMLSVHDIGETLVGDTFILDKTSQDDLSEAQAALTLLPEYMHSLYLEFEKQETPEAKYAWCIDKLAPKFIEANFPNRTTNRLQEIGRKIEDFTVGEREQYNWSKFLGDVYDIMIDHYTNVKDGESPIFEVSYLDK